MSKKEAAPENLGALHGSVNVPEVPQAWNESDRVANQLDSCVRKVASVHDSMKVLNDERNKLSEHAQYSLARLFEWAIERMRLQ